MQRLLKAKAGSLQTQKKTKFGQKTLLIFFSVEYGDYIALRIFNITLEEQKTHLRTKNPIFKNTRWMGLQSRPKNPKFPPISNESAGSEVCGISYHISPVRKGNSKLTAVISSLLSSYFHQEYLGKCILEAANCPINLTKIGSWKEEI